VIRQSEAVDATRETTRDELVHGRSAIGRVSAVNVEIRFEYQKAPAFSFSCIGEDLSPAKKTLSC